MNYGLFIFIITAILSIGISMVIISARSRQYERSLNGHSLDEFSLWMEQLQSEIDITDRLKEYRELLMTIIIVIMAYAKRIRPYRLRAIIQQSS